MADARVACASVMIAAPRETVWDALVSSETMKRYLPVTDVVEVWRPARPFRWRMEMLGKSYDVEGTVLRFDAGDALEYEYLDPLSPSVRGVANVHRVKIELRDEGAGTRISVVQDHNVTKAALAHAEGGWRLALNNLKAIVERARTVAHE